MEKIKKSSMKIPKSLKDFHLLERNERIELTNKLLLDRPESLKPIAPHYWRFRPCEVNVLLVADRFLHFGIDDFGLSEFISSFRKIEQESNVNIKYNVTLAHRQDPTNPSQGMDPMYTANASISNRIVNFNFATSVNLSKFDQVWIFSTGSGNSTLSKKELTAITKFMDGGGGLFATGDHGSLGKELCSQIPRVKDMRIWDNTNEVSMSGKRRNDTNRPAAGATISNRFDNQSDDIPQNIAVRAFGNGLPHPLLSISTRKRASGIIDIMPDHPHEGECKNEVVFSVMNPVTKRSQNISTQIIATSFVLGGSTSGSKDATEPHCFPSISVFDGRLANIGRIVIDSTWHHFVNINLNGVGTSENGLKQSDYNAVQQYYMNIAVWMSRKKSMLCWRKRIWFDLLTNSQVIEASLDDPNLDVSEIKLTDLNSIGALAKEIISDRFSPAFGHEFIAMTIKPIFPELYEHLNLWKPEGKNGNDFNQNWLNIEPIVGMALGAGLLSLKKHEELLTEEFHEESEARLEDVFFQGAKYGAEIALSDMESEISFFTRSLIGRKE